jgi:hypothetical protein
MLCRGGFSKNPLRQTRAKVCALSSYTVTFSFRVSNQAPCLVGLGLVPTKRLSWSFVPFSVSQTEEPAYPGFTSPGTFRSQGFAPSQRLTSPLSFLGLFHPSSALGILPSGLSLLVERERLSAPSPLLPLSPRALPVGRHRFSARARKRWAIRLQGFVPYRSPF